MKYKICVYAICKNEESNILAWLKSVKDADYIVVLDTGSTDNSYKLLKNNNVIVQKKKITPWRFDKARNESLKLIPKDTDICICLDLDERIQNGWRYELEKIWTKKTNRIKYIYNWSLDKNDKPIITYYHEKIHSYNNYTWIYPVHEILKYTGDNEKTTITDKIIINHYPKNKNSRKNYLKLLKLAIKENPESDRNIHYLGREYMYYEKYNEAIDTLIKHIKMPTSTWKDERCASMRFIARCYKHLNRLDEARMWAIKAINEAPHLKDSYMELALIEDEEKNYNRIKELCLKALSLSNDTQTYINETFSQNDFIYNLLSISYFYLGKYNESLDAINKSLEINPDNKRIKENKKIIINYINEKDL